MSLRLFNQPWTKPKLTFAPPALQAWATAARWTGWTPTGRSSGCGSAWWKTQRCLRSALWCCDPACANTTHKARGGLRTERMRRVPGEGKEYEDVRSREIKQNTERDGSRDWPTSFFVPVTSCPDPSSYPTSHALRSSTCGPSEASSLSQALLFTVLCWKKKNKCCMYQISTRRDASCGSSSSQWLMRQISCLLVVEAGRHQPQIKSVEM